MDLGEIKGSYAQVQKQYAGKREQARRDPQSRYAIPEQAAHLQQYNTISIGSVMANKLQY